jgi:SAM-dependent methyltransferase
MGIQGILRGQYRRAMDLAYAFARQSALATPNASAFLDCGCGRGNQLGFTQEQLAPGGGIRYTGLEWSQPLVDDARQRGLNVVQADLNRWMPLDSGSQDCVVALSVVEHLLMPCRFLTECHRVLRPGGRLVVLTPNIATYFTALLVLAGRMPSSGPHPDSNSFAEADQFLKVSAHERGDISVDSPEHRHLVVFSYSALRRILVQTGFELEASRAFGYYPLPKFIQPLFERLDPFHSHQMVLVGRKRG